MGEARVGRFGTFGGVFTPSVLTILGVIMFMRAGFVVGQAGVWEALLILGIAKLITTLTSLSLSAIATNTEVGTGGNYFMISRTLGADFGGTIGVTLYVSQAVAIAFYVIGFSEATFGLLAPPGSEQSVWIEAWRIPQLTSTVVVLLLFALTFKGAEVALKAQYVILVVLLASVVSFVVGGITAFDGAVFSANGGPAEGGVGFWTAFAIFFPAATGIEAGANMSGDLKDPAKSIPRGTLAAVAFTAVVYLVELVLLGGYADRQALIDDPFGSLCQMSVFGPLVIAGVMAGTLSSALGSFLGAPRILQAMGKDELMKPLRYFAVGHGPSEEPRRATVLSLVIALAVLWGGNLNAVAEIISMFFLIAYGMMNVSAFVEARSGNPSFRPRFRYYGWGAALAGAIGCGIAMIKINETYALVAMALSAIIYLALKGRIQGDFGDAKRGFVFARVRENLLKLERSPPDPKNWRPMLSVITSDVERDRQMIATASWVEGRRGLLAIVEVASDPAAATAVRLESARLRERKVRAMLLDAGVEAFFDSIVVAEERPPLDTVLQAYSLGSLRPNTVMLSVPPPGQVERRRQLAADLRLVTAFGRNLIVYKGARQPAGRKRIDLWWHGQKNGSLMALLAYLCSQHPEWRMCKVRLLRVVASPADQGEAEGELGGLTAAARLDMDIEIILSAQPIAELIVDKSASSDLVLLGMAEASARDFEGYLAGADEMLMKLPPTLLVLSNGEVDLLA